MSELIAYGDDETSAEFDVAEGSPRSLFLKGSEDGFPEPGVQFTVARQNADDGAAYTSLAILNSNNFIQLGTVTAAGHYKVSRKAVEPQRRAGLDITDQPDEG